MGAGAGWWVAAVAAVVALCIAGAAASRAHRANHEQNVHDELSLMLWDILASEMTVAEQEHSLEVLASRVRAWRREHGMNTEEAPPEAVELLWQWLMQHLTLIVITSAVGCGGAGWLLGWASSGARGSEREAKRERGRERRRRLEGPRPPLSISAPEAADEGTADGAQALDEAPPPAQEAQAATHADVPEDVLQHILDTAIERYLDLAKRPDEKSKRESLELGLKLRKLNLQQKQTGTSMDAHQRNLDKDDDKFFAAWASNVTGILSAMFYVWVGTEIYCRAFTGYTAPKVSPWLVRSLPSFLSSPLLMATSALEAGQVFLTVALLLSPFILALFAWLSFPMLPFKILVSLAYAVTGSLWILAQPLDERVRVAYLAFRPAAVWLLLIVVSWLLIWIIRLKTDRKGHWRGVCVRVLYGAVLMVSLVTGITLAATDNSLFWFEPWLLDLWDTAFLALLHSLPQH
mmetsp:Transcript_2243/g.7994  ORF Transcript_2243/g.7994 Transcript_2243/m.7994 type:complete len:462 (+) Transcript_2243:93-1478(+)